VVQTQKCNVKRRLLKEWFRPRDRAKCENSPTAAIISVFEVNVSDLGPVSERRLSENSEYVNPEMRETLGFPFQKGR